MRVTPSNKGISTYVLTLSRTIRIACGRSPLFNLMHMQQGQAFAGERELGATAASVVNRFLRTRRPCIALHQLHQAHRRDQRGLHRRTRRRTRRALPVRSSISRRICRRRRRRRRKPMRGILADVGLSGPIRSLDLVLSTAIFGWANRLMHTLGRARQGLTGKAKAGG